MEKDKKYNLILGIMIFLFVLIVALAICVGLLVIDSKTNKGTGEAQNNEIGIENTNKDSEESKEQVTSVEENAIKEYVAKIYKYGTIGTIPNFSNINEADEEWIWYVSFWQCKNVEIAYKSEIISNAKELFGTEFSKEPGTNILGTYWDEEGQYYTTKAHGLMVEEEPHYIVYDIAKNDNKYSVEIVEYVLDKSEVLKEMENATSIGIKNKDKELTKVSASAENNEIEKYVKENASQFTSRVLELKEVNGKFHIVSCKNK